MLRSLAVAYPATPENGRLASSAAAAYITCVLQATDPRSPAGTDPELAALVLALYDVAGHARRFQSLDPVDTAGVRLLYGLGHGGPLRPSALAALNMLDLSTVSRHLKGMEEAGYVRRLPDPDDGRASRFEVTEAGHAVLAAVVANRVAALADTLDRWTPDDRTTLAHLLRRLADDLSAEAGCPVLPSGTPSPSTATRSTQENL
jgi:DNA-binding MarR family transcriptional regulator